MRAFWSLNEDILNITVLKTNMSYPSRKIWCIRACSHQRPRRNKDQYAVSRENQYAVFKIWNQYNILEDIKRGPYSKKSRIRRDLDNSTSNVLIPLDSWTSRLLVYKLPLSGLRMMVKMDDPNITMKEYIRLEKEKARRRGKVYNWETATYGKIWDNEDVHDLESVETEFPSLVFNDTLTSEAALSCEPTVSSLNNDEIDFRISFDESDDEDCTIIFDKNSFSYKIISVNDLKTDSENDDDKVNMPLFPSPKPTVSYFDDLDFFKDFENEFPAIVYNDAQTSKSDLLTEPILNPQHIDEFNLKDETSLSECDEEEQNVLNFNDLFPFNVIYPDELKMDTDNDNDKVDIEHSSGDLSVKPLPDVSIRRILGNGYGVLTSCTVLGPRKRKIDDVGRESTKSGDTKVLES
ncbi:hypothetical protein Tco_1229469 [Tanacetum coccineum]